MITKIDRKNFAQEFSYEPKTFLDNVIDWINLHLAPEDIFPDERLEAWAVNNHYVSEEEATWKTTDD